MNYAQGSSDAPVLIVSTKVDVATDAVIQRLLEKNTPFIRLNTEEYPYHLQASTRIISGKRDRFAFEIGHQSAEYRSIWWRRIRSPEVPPDMDKNVHAYCARESCDFLTGTVLGSACPKMSCPASVWAAEHKLYQLNLARACGFKIPRTIATNDEDEIRAAFDAFEGRMIAKPIRSGYVTPTGEERAIYTSEILSEHLLDLSNAKFCPSIFQQLQPKEYDIRATVVGERIFVAEIDSQSDPAALVDWRRTTDPDLPHYRTELPSHIKAKVRKLMSALGLSFGARDLVLRPDGEYVFLEINPSGQWLWLDNQLQLGITEAVSDWLTTPQ